jgi:hypothetical protein
MEWRVMKRDGVRSSCGVMKCDGVGWSVMECDGV